MAESLDMVYRFAALDAGAVSGFAKLGEASRYAAVSTKELTAATARASEAEKLAASATMRAAEVRIQASAAMAHAKDLEIRGDSLAATAAREGADALALQARAAQATARELTASATATERQAAVMRKSRDANLITATSLGGVFKQASGLSSAMEKIPTPVTAVAGALGSMAVKAGEAGLAIAGVSIYLAQGFQTAMTRLHTQANVSTADVEVLSKGVLNMAASVATTPKILADAAYHIASVGQGSMTTAQELAVLKVAAEGAKLGGADLVDVTNALDAALVAGLKGVHNYSQTMGVLNSTVGAGDMSMQDLADAFGPLGSTFKAYNVTIQQAGAALAVFGDNNMRGAEAGTQLRMGIQALTKPVKGATDALKLLGLTGKDATSHFAEELQHGGLTAALDDLHKRLHNAGITTAQTGKVLVDAFGRKAGIGLTTLLEELGRYHTKLREVSADGGQFAGSWAAYTKTFQFNADSAKAALEKVGIELGNRLLPIATRVLHWLATDGVKYLDSFGQWFERNKATIAHFASFLITEFGAMIGIVLDFAKVVIDSMGHAFGWVPGIGGKLKHAQQAFDHFYAVTEDGINRFAAAIYSMGDSTGQDLGAGLVAGMQAKEHAVTTEAKIIADQAVKGMRLAAQVHSPSRLTTYIGKMLAEGLIGGFTGEAGKIKALLGTSVEDAMNALTSRVLSILNRQKGILKAAQSRLHSDLASMRADTASLAGSIAGGSDLSGAFTQDANGNTVLGNVGQFEAGQVGPLKQFAADLKWAAAHHLNPTDLAQIANLGAVQGDQILRQFMSGQSSIADVDASRALISRYSTAAASTVEGSVYAGRLAADRKNIHEQTVTLHRIERVLHAIERHAAEDIARNIHITVDSKGRMKLVQEDGREIVRVLRELERKGIKI